MRSIKIAFAFCAFALFIIACNSNQTASTTTSATPASSNTTPPVSTAASTSPPDELADARTTFSQVCARCHKPDGTGGIFKDESGELKVSDLHSERTRNKPDERLARKIANGGEGMPAFGKRLAPERINALVHFIRVEFQGQK